MPEPMRLHLTLEGEAGTLVVDGPLALWQALLASLGRAPTLPGPESEDDPEAEQPDELYGGE